MIRPHRFVMLLALSASATVGATAVAPQVSGTISQTSPMGPDTHVVIDGHTYVVNSQTQLTGSSTPLQRGQKVTLFLGSDGKTVILSQANTTTPPHP